MPAKFNVELSLPGSPDDAQQRAVTALKQPAHRIGLKLRKKEAGRLTYRPHYVFPAVIMLSRYIAGEGMTATFTADNGGTRVILEGKIPSGKKPLADQKELWTEALNAS